MSNLRERSMGVTVTRPNTRLMTPISVIVPPARITDGQILPEECTVLVGDPVVKGLGPVHPDNCSHENVNWTARDHFWHRGEHRMDFRGTCEGCGSAVAKWEPYESPYERTYSSPALYEPVGPRKPLIDFAAVGKWVRDIPRATLAYRPKIKF